MTVQKPGLPGKVNIISVDRPGMHSLWEFYYHDREYVDHYICKKVTYTDEWTGTRDVEVGARQRSDITSAGGARENSVRQALRNDVLRIPMSARTTTRVERDLYM